MRGAARPSHDLAMLECSMSFGDNVRIRPSPEAERLGVAGRVGSVRGETTPSVSGVDVVGVMERDFAVNVFFDDLDEGFWFAEQLVEFVDHGAGAEIRIYGVDKRWVRGEDGEWIEHDVQ
ncbi:hypothetical protein [Caulobacter endophyticus]|uniref:Uncharacterized protein n=1 Tax=Caulobacter endophyticus TaxID=2172652 RepID=A0A2T9KD51_9CAUL|nr:hypothetical protein [Caulobacter endophyticus]PVM93906.1 hypothetical protein DDF67_01245 [Caulobacter endophyticus]